MKFKKYIKASVFLLALLLGAMLYYAFQPVSNADLKKVILEESALIRADIRAGAQDVTGRLDKIEAKLDKLLDIATAPHDTGLQR